MAVAGEMVEVLAGKFEVLLPHLDERQRRLYLGSEARALGHGGIAAVARAAGVSRQTVMAGVGELEAGRRPPGRTRRAGGGRKRVAELDLGLRPALLALVEPEERGDPVSPLRWTTKSTRTLAAELTRQGHPVSADTVAGLLREEGFSLQGNAKTIEGRQHPDRDAQFRYINDRVAEHLAAGAPVISVDTKKKELVGQYANGGREWRPKGDPVKVSDHDFPGDDGKAVPYGIYDVAANSGWVNVGTDGDTAEFAVESIRRWWNAAGRPVYSGAKRLLITADCGGSNGYRTRAWKTELAALAVETGLEITVVHFPPGTSKWNKIEHRLFSHITLNWRGRPLTSHQVIVNSIAATTTSTGLTVHAELDTGAYPTGVKISDGELAVLPLARHRFHGDWNYTLHPAIGHTTEPVADDPTGTHVAAPGWGPGQREFLSDPELTGMPRHNLADLTAHLAPAQAAQREQQRHRRRGAGRRRAAGAGPRPQLTDADRILATILYLRRSCTHALLAELFTVNRSTITRAIEDTRDLLNQHGCAITPSTARFRTPADVIAFLTHDNPRTTTKII